MTPLRFSCPMLTTSCVRNYSLARHALCRPDRLDPEQVHLWALHTLALGLSRVLSRKVRAAAFQRGNLTVVVFTTTGVIYSNRSPWVLL